ncbi:hypothetical protein RJT34_20197 [Clitoria ternatea]|uniref:Uncharacterized protein n=1 Tax=Clitoria ternatea TaxID=43366 RepID=A0AAN9P5J2_CLITE
MWRLRNKLLDDAYLESNAIETIYDSVATQWLSRKTYTGPAFCFEPATLRVPGMEPSGTQWYLAARDSVVVAVIEFTPCFGSQNDEKGLKQK